MRANSPRSAIRNSRGGEGSCRMWVGMPSAMSTQRTSRSIPQPFAAYHRADELLADPNLDLVSICTPTDSHIDLATRALRAGKHVLVEKPVSLVADQIRRLDAIAKETGKLCMPAMCMRFWPAWAWLKDRIQDRQYGACVSATFQRLASMPRWSGFFADGAKSGGALVDLHIHDADFIYWCFGKPESVSSIGRTGASGAVDHVTSMYRFAKSQAAVHVVAEGGWDHHEGFAFRMRYIAIFEDATAEFDLVARSAATALPQWQIRRCPTSRAVRIRRAGETSHRRDPQQRKVNGRDAHRRCPRRGPARCRIPQHRQRQFGANLLMPLTAESGCFDCFQATGYRLTTLPGGVAERLNAPVLKTGRPARVSWVRIPPPPFFILKARNGAIARVVLPAAHPDPAVA